MLNYYRFLLILQPNPTEIPLKQTVSLQKWFLIMKFDFAFDHLKLKLTDKSKFFK